ncbi:MAG: RHS repeat-associated core domain-containing protein [Pirellulales bacterium]
MADVRNSTRDVVRWLYDDKLWHWEHVVYDSYGNIAVSWAADPYYGVMYATAYLNWTNYGYTGEERDSWSGYSIHGRRWYDPTVGNWLTQDPIGFDAGDANLGRYVGNSPTIYVDPTGLHYVELPGPGKNGQLPILDDGRFSEVCARGRLQRSGTEISANRRRSLSTQQEHQRSHGGSGPQDRT